MTTLFPGLLQTFNLGWFGQHSQSRCTLQSKLKFYIVIIYVFVFLLQTSLSENCSLLLCCVGNSIFRSEYDFGVNTFSPEGRIFQVEYAIEAIKVMLLFFIFTFATIKHLNTLLFFFASFLEQAPRLLIYCFRLYWCTTFLFIALHAGLLLIRFSTARYHCYWHSNL